MMLSFVKFQVNPVNFDGMSKRSAVVFLIFEFRKVV